MRLAIVASSAALLCSAAFPFSSVAAQSNVVPAGVVETPVRVQLDAMPTGSLVSMLMRDVMKVPYVISSEVLTDRKPVSVNLVMPRREIPKQVFAFLRGIGLKVELVGGTVYVSRSQFGRGGNTFLPGQIPSADLADPRFAPASSNPGGAVLPGQVSVASPALAGSASPVAGFAPAASADAPAPVVAIIRPAHREPVEFVDVLQTVLPDINVAARETSEPNGAEISPANAPDRLVLSGREDLVLRALDVVKAMDRPRASVVISAVIFELSETSTRNTALSVFADLFGGRIGGDSLTAEPIGSQAVSIAVGGLRAILSAVREDGRFTVVAEPQVRVQSGSVATINAGADVPTLGAVSYTDSGQPIRSVVYRQSGVTLTVRPVVMGEEVQLSVQQERSSFVRTNTGVEDSPTLNQTSVSSQFGLKSGETLLLAGLDERSTSKTNAGLLGGLLGAKGSEKRESQLLLLLQAEIVPHGPLKALTAQIVGASEAALQEENEKSDI